MSRFVVYPFKAVYAYTPSKLPSSVATHLKPRPTEEMNGDEAEMVTKPIPRMSLSVSDERTASNGLLDELESVTTSRKASSVSSGEGTGTIVVYRRREEGRNDPASLHEDGTGRSNGDGGGVAAGGGGGGTGAAGSNGGGRSNGDGGGVAAGGGGGTGAAGSNGGGSNIGAGGSIGLLTQSGIRRSCSLDGVALASRCHGDDDSVHRHGRNHMRNESSDDDWCSQGDVHLVSSSSFLLILS